MNKKEKISGIAKKPHRKLKIFLLIFVLLAAAIFLFQLVTYISNASKERIGKCDINAVKDVDKYREYYNTLVWSDEFDGESLDKTKWRFEGHNTNRNHELQCYADSEDDKNTGVYGGMLHIIGKKEERYGKQYTSASITTKGKATFKYGRFEMRAKLPEKFGSWPAFWMMGQKRHFSFLYWPFAGEIDVMESICRNEENKVVHQNLHTPKFEGFEYFSLPSYYRLKNGAFNEDFHIFGFIWTDKELLWYVDNDVAHAVDIKDERFDIYRKYADYIIINLAIGGSWAGAPARGEYNDEYVIDYVRVYQ